MISMTGLTLPQSWPQLFVGRKSLYLLGLSYAIPAVSGRTVHEHAH